MIMARARLAEEYGIDWKASAEMPLGDVRWLIERANERAKQGQEEPAHKAPPGGMTRVRL